MGPPDSLNQESIMQTFLDNFSRGESWHMVFHGFITARHAGVRATTSGC